MKYRHTDGALVLKFTDDAVVRNSLLIQKKNYPNSITIILK